MSAVEKVLRKVEQDRVRGQDERALTRLKAALAETPHEFLLAREATTLCFELRRIVEGVGILRSTLRRCPQERGEIVQLAQEEFQRQRSLELGEFLFDVYLSDSDLDKARETVGSLDPADLDKLLAKLRAKAQSLQEDVPGGEAHHDARVYGIWLAEALVLAALGRWSDLSNTCDRILDRETRFTEALGHLCKLEMQSHADCSDLRFVLGRCYLHVGDFTRAADQFQALASEARMRVRAIHVLARAPHSPPLLPVRSRLLLLEEQFDAAHELLEEFCKGGGNAMATVRTVLESVPGAAHATERLRQLYARVLAGTSAVERAVRELEETRQGGEDPAAALPVVDQILAQRPRDVDALLLRARLSLDVGNADDAAVFYRRALEADPRGNAELRGEIAAAYARTRDASIGQLLVAVLTDLDTPHEAAATLQELRDMRRIPAAALHALTLAIASRYGLSAELLAMFVEAAVELGHADEARAAVAHYHATAGTRVHDFAARLGKLLQERPELADGCARALIDVNTPPALRLALLRASLTTGDSQTTLHELGLLVAEVPELGNEVLELLGTFLHARGEIPHALELTAELLLDADRPVDCAESLARALRAEPAAADRICRRADRLFAHAPAEAGVWRPLVLALLDVRRPRHVRDLCYRAAQSVPAAQQGFLHFALGSIQMESGQASAAANAFQNALECQDAPLDRLITALRRIADGDAQLGHARYVLARALLRAGGHAAEAVALLSEAVRLDQMLADLVLDTLEECAGTLADHGAALALAGTLWLRRGEHARGVALLDQALRAAPELGNQILLALQVEWDRDAENPETGLALAHALLACKQEKRACRLLAELAQRFPALREQLAVEVETLLQHTPFPEAHRVLWDILLAKGARDEALHRVRDTVSAEGMTPETRLELLESALQRFPQETWIACRLAALEIRSGHTQRGEAKLRALLEHGAEARDPVLAVLREAGAAATEALALLEIDTLHAASRWNEVHAALQRFRGNFPTAGEAVLQRLRRLVADGDTGGAADLDLAMLLQRQGELEEAIAVLHRVLSRGEHAAAVQGSLEATTPQTTASDETYVLEASAAPQTTTSDEAYVLEASAAPQTTASDEACILEASAAPQTTTSDEAYILEATAVPQTLAGHVAPAVAATAAPTADAQPATTRLQEIRLLLASMYVDMGRVAEGKEILAPILQAGDASAEAYATLERLSTQGLHAKMEQLRATSVRAPSNLRARLELARLSLLARDFAAARDALSFPADGAAMEVARRYLLARSYADAEQPHLAAAVARDIDVTQVSDPELRRNVLHLRARCSEQLGRFGEAHVLYLRLIGEFPDFKVAQERVRKTYQMHLESSLEPRALVLEKRTNLDSP